MTHGELEGLLNQKSNKIWSYPFWVKRCFQQDFQSNIYRIVLGHSIKNYLDEKSLVIEIFLRSTSLEQVLRRIIL